MAKTEFVRQPDKTSELEYMRWGDTENEDNAGKKRITSLLLHKAKQITNVDSAA